MGEKGQERGDRGYASLRTPAIRLVAKKWGGKVDILVKERETECMPEYVYLRDEGAVT